MNKIELNDKLFKDNAGYIGKRVLDEIKKRQYTNKQIADFLYCNENTISRKNNNKGGMYYNKDDLTQLAKLFNCSIEYFCFEELDNDILEENKELLENNYRNTINYLNSIGIHIYPGYFWRGTNKQLLNALKTLNPYFTDKAKEFYKKNKNDLDNCNFENEIIIPLKDNPIKKCKYSKTLEEIQIKTRYNHGFIGFLNYDKKPFNETIKAGQIEIRFYIYNDNSNNDYTKTISVFDLCNLFQFMDKITKTSINSLLNNSIQDYYDLNNTF